MQQDNKKICVFTNGCFDLLHPGHISYLNEAKSLGNWLIIGLNTDNSIKRLKGENRPIQDQNIRKIMLENLKCVDEVILFDEDTPLNLIKKIKPNVLVKGGDYKIEQIIGHEFVSSYGGVVKTISFLDGYSTTQLIQRIQQNEISHKKDKNSLYLLLIMITLCIIVFLRYGEFLRHYYP